MSAVTLNLEELRAVRAELKRAESARVKVGILGDKAGRWGPGSGDMNNPSLGVVHEFGSIKRGIPARSFLRMPLMTRLPGKIDEIGREVWRKLILDKGAINALKALGVIAENLVQRAFETGGFGQWPKLSPRYARWKAALVRARGGRVSILILTGQLRRSVTSRVDFYGAKGNVAKGGARASL